MTLKPWLHTVHIAMQCSWMRKWTTTQDKRPSRSLLAPETGKAGVMVTLQAADPIKQGMQNCHRATEHPRWLSNDQAMRQDEVS